VSVVAELGDRIAGACRCHEHHGLPGFSWPGGAPRGGAGNAWWYSDW
jgi:hypothetical protein